MRVCYLDCQAELCCYIVIHIKNLLHPLQLFHLLTDPPSQLLTGATPLLLGFWPPSWFRNSEIFRGFPRPTPCRTRNTVLLAPIPWPVCMCDPTRSLHSRQHSSPGGGVLLQYFLFSFIIIRNLYFSIIMSMPCPRPLSVTWHKILLLGCEGVTFSEGKTSLQVSQYYECCRCYIHFCTYTWAFSLFCSYFMRRAELKWPIASRKLAPDISMFLA
jgi:hypothetical protein